MSYWTYINGTITVEPMGRTQAEKRYILDTVLEHLPIVTGSEMDMNVYVIQKDGYNSSSSCDEFGQVTNNLRRRMYSNGWMQIQSEYILVVDAALRDRTYEDTYIEFQKWLCRLSKRVEVINLLVKVNGYEKSEIITNKNNVYSKMFEWPAWTGLDKDNSPNWCEYLMWDRAKNSDFPMILQYKYFRDEENDKELERRINYYKK